jgi:Zn-dependent protease
MDFGRARYSWSRALTMLPPESTQAAWIRDHLQALAQTPAVVQDQKKSSTHPWARRLGPLAPIAILLAKGKSLFLILFKLKFLLSFFSFFALYGAIYGWRFGAGFAASILIHEMGHFIDIKRRGLPAEMPVFLPGLGAYVRWKNLGVTKRQQAQISLAGPLAGWMAAAVCVLLYLHTHDLLWAALAHTGAVINLLNLIPVWALDGGKAINALGLTERIALLVAAIALGIYMRNPLFFLVAAGTGWRLFTKDKPAESDWGTWLYFAALLAALGATLTALPILVHSAAR